jgi:acyl-CoA synthetase (NDP forming)
MSVRNLEHLFRLTFVAVIGVPKRPHSVAHTVKRNLFEGGVAG